jgi:hypothetical protein
MEVFRSTSLNVTLSPVMVRMNMIGMVGRKR